MLGNMYRIYHISHGGGRLPGVVVVHYVLAVAVVALQPSAHRTHPRHVDVALKDAEVVEGGGFQF